MALKEVETWAELAQAILAMTPEQQKQPIQCCQPTPNCDDVQEMVSGIAIATVAEFEFAACRSVHNNKYCPNDVVLLMDANPFSQDGAWAYQWEEDGTEVPVYGESGQTMLKDQMAPNGDGSELAYLDQTLKHRVKSL